MLPVVWGLLCFTFVCVVRGFNLNRNADSGERGRREREGSADVVIEFYIRCSIPPLQEQFID